MAVWPPKIHNDGMPLCPIMYYTNSMVYKTLTTITDLTEFGKDVNNLVIDDEIMNSHDVVNLFTNVPIQVAMDVIRYRLVKNKTLSKHTDLSADDIISLLKFIMSVTYFQFEGQLYQHVDNAPMGSLVSVVVAEMLIEDLEQPTMSGAPLTMKVNIWK